MTEEPATSPTLTTDPIQLTPSGSVKVRPATVWNYFLYVASLPERIARSTAGFVGMIGLAAARLLPRPVRESRIYRTVVLRYMRILTDDLGGARRFPASQAMTGTMVARLGVGSVIDNLCIATLHASPLWILLATKDIADGARTVVHDVIEDLKNAGLVKPGSRVDNVDLLFSALANLSDRAGDAVDLPPLRIEDMRAQLAEIRAELASASKTAIFDVAQIDKLAEGVESLAKDTGQSVFEVITGLAVQAAAKGGKFVIGTGAAAALSVKALAKHLVRDVFLDYQSLLDELEEKGLFRALAETLHPHVRATQRNFSFERLTWTEIGLSFGKLRNARWRVQ